ncbi:hypothetical protein PsorP6_008368 [Peronosclerospora sorghi]|uniref:Uncharacterized protein n=1 Tax=Peronosclerospora sorghi TaxID=230839 RepID=A0ACC0W9Z7_9STRA|nr:hypothetical protein PsorP6_008368 [Peronosclerospora sorghi]
MGSFMIKEGNNCVTPTQAVVGLKPHSGYRAALWSSSNTTENGSGIAKKVKELDRQLKQTVKRANDIIYFYDERRLVQNKKWTQKALDPLRYCSFPDLTLTAFEYSGIGDGKSFQCNPYQNTCVPETRISGNMVEEKSLGEDSDEEGEDEEETSWLAKEGCEEQKLTTVLKGSRMKKMTKWKRWRPKILIARRLRGQ